MFDLERAIRERHSTRMFLPKKPVTRALLDEALALAQHAPSNSNIQPWHVVFASGPPRDRLVSALLEEARRRPPSIPPLPESFQHFDDDPSPVSRWLRAFARWVNTPQITEQEGRERGGEDAVYYGTNLRGATNAKAKTTLSFAPRRLEWLDERIAPSRRHGSDRRLHQRPGG